MSDASLIIHQPGLAAREVSVASGATVSIGRALDNVICLDGDPNISRYHAVIEARHDGLYLSDLGSSNGTTVAELPINYEHKLRDGDRVVLGNSSVIEFRARAAGEAAANPQQRQAGAGGSDAMQAASASASAETVTAPAGDAANAAPTSSTSRTSVALIAAACVGLVIVVGVVALYASGVVGGCQPSARIVSPTSGTTVRGSVRVRVETENAKCIERVIFQLDGAEVARAEASPYAVTLSAKDVTTLSGDNHVLTVTVEDEVGKKRLQPDEILLAFAAAAAADQTPTPAPLDGQRQTDDGISGPMATLPPPGGLDVSGLSSRLATQISRKSGYNIDPEFAEAIRLRTGEYRQGGYTDRARTARREINKAYRDRGLEPLLGYAMAMSRSKLNASQSGAEGATGLWQISPVVAQTYLAPGETTTALADPKRSAEISATYMKALIDVFELDDFMYAVACFGMPLGRAGELRTKLVTAAPDPAARRDFWKMVRSGVVSREQADQVARFFAAGVVGENPQAFGLNNEQSFSSLY